MWHLQSHIHMLHRWWKPDNLYNGHIIEGFRWHRKHNHLLYTPHKLLQHSSNVHQQDRHILRCLKSSHLYNLCIHINLQMNMPYIPVSNTLSIHPSHWVCPLNFSRHKFHQYCSDSLHTGYKCPHLRQHKTCNHGWYRVSTLLRGWVLLPDFHTNIIHFHFLWTHPYIQYNSLHFLSSRIHSWSHYRFNTIHNHSSSFLRGTCTFLSE